jgi:ABC-type bacteriocin/lantibiotic exporter with double-glycine peptidase domain
MNRVTSCCCLLMLLLQSSFCINNPSSSLDNNNSFSNSEACNLKDRYACGRNCVYVLLRLNGISCDYSRVCSEVPIGLNGTSILDLKEGISKCGLDSLIVHCDYDYLMKLEFSVIGWIQSEYSSEAGIGHLVVILSSDDQKVEYIDGTSGKLKKMKTEIFKRLWNGIVVVPRHALDQWSNFHSFQVLLLVFGLAVIAVSAWLYKHRRDLICLFIFILLICNLLFPNHSVSATLTERDCAIWRTKEHDSINAIYLLLRAHGIQCNYTEVASLCPVGQTDFRQLRDVARQFGLRVDVFRCQNPSDLKKLHLPFLIHTYSNLKPSNIESSDRSGNISMVTAIPKGCYHLIECGYVVFREVSEESFRLNWSGYVLAVSSQNNKLGDTCMFCLSLLVGGIMLTIYCTWQKINKKD